jgi:hypothetical protein
MIYRHCQMILQMNNLLQKPEAVRIYRLPEQSS